MPRAHWRLVRNRPVIQVHLDDPKNGSVRSRRLLADTGGGSDRSPFEIVLTEDDCRTCGVYTYHSVRLAGSYTGWVPVFAIRIKVPDLDFDGYVRVAAVQRTTPGLDGIACFRFLNRFNYGNFGRADQFGLET
jgi:hypothetical protein